jgi:hypothetical protein
MPPLRSSTTVRLSRPTHQVAAQLAAEQGRTLSDFIGDLVERARRRHILDQSAARMAELMADPEERRSYHDELALSEGMAADALRDEPPYCA